MVFLLGLLFYGMDFRDLVDHKDRLVFKGWRILDRRDMTESVGLVGPALRETPVHRVLLVPRDQEVLLVQRVLPEQQAIRVLRVVVEQVRLDRLDRLVHPA